MLPDPSRRRHALRMASAYVALAVLWILSSDTLLGLITDAGTVSQLGTIKGLVFVALTGALLYAALLLAPGAGRAEARTAAVSSAMPDALPDAPARTLNPLPWAVLVASLGLIGTVTWGGLQAYGDQVMLRLGHDMRTVSALQVEALNRWASSQGQVPGAALNPQALPATLVAALQAQGSGTALGLRTLLIEPDGPGQVVRLDTAGQVTHLPAAGFAPERGQRDGAVLARAGLRLWTDPAGHTLIYIRQAVAGTPWSLVTAIDRERAERPIQQARLAAAALALICLVAAGVFFHALRQRDRLTSALDALQHQREVDDARQRAAQAEAAVSASESKFRSYMEHAPVGVAVLDGQGRIIEMNACAQGLLGCTASPVGLRLMKVASFAQPAGLLSTWAQLKVQGHARTEVVVNDADLGTRWLWLTATRLDADCYLGYFVDITRMKQEELRLRRAEAVFNNTLEGLVITDPKAQVVAVNPAFSQVTGYSEQELVGQNMRIVSSGRQDREFYAAMWRKLITTGTWQGEVWNRRKTGEVYPLRLSINAVRDTQGRVINYVGACTDITKVKESERALDHLVHHDALTGLPNRLMFTSLLDHAIQRARRSGSLGAVLILDLDRFKTVNDSLGHPAGDQLLQVMATRLRHRLREADTLVRLGGDEFAVLIEDMHEPQDAAVVASHLIDGCNLPVALNGGHEVYVGVSIGISLFPADSTDGHELLKHADAALYGAKDSGRGTYHFYTDSLTRQAQQRLDTESRLRRALERNELELHYQALVGVHDEVIHGVEALVRWRDPQRGLVPPGDFIPLAEETGLIVPMGHWVLREACRQMSAWVAQGFTLRTMAVNLSAQHFAQAGLDAEIAAILRDTGLPAAMLELEITETALMDAGRASEQLHRLKTLGVKLAIDDFGTGYSSLAYLSSFPLDKLKVDRSFVKDLPHDSTEAEIASAIIQLARALNLKVLAEGVETAAQLDFLRERGCDLAQGFLFARPQPADQVAKLLVTQTEAVAA